MDNNPFDALTKALAAGVSRREVLKMLGVALLSASGFRSEDSRAATSAGVAHDPAHKDLSANEQAICRHKGHQKKCNGVCCANHGTCETKGHSHGVSCAHGHCCRTGESCCASLDRNGRVSETCCKANETCVTTSEPDGTYTGVCRRIKPLV